MKSMEGADIILKDVVLLGGGHSHVAVLKSFGMKPMPGVRLTLVTKDIYTPYSGMLPGYVSGNYTFEECHIDLCRLASFAQARLIHAEGAGIDTKERRLLLRGRPALAYDVLSIDIGITPRGVPGALSLATAVKPISNFVERFQAMLERAASSDHALTVAVVGGGAGGVELSMAVEHRLELERQAGGRPDSLRAKVKLYTQNRMLELHVPAARAKFLHIMKERGIEVHENVAIQEVQKGRLVLTGGQEEIFDECLWCTSAAAAPWLQDTRLPTDEKGFLAINEFLQSAGGPPEVFAAGDVASSVTDPRPKSGVFAVRQGPALTANLRRFLAGQPLRPFKPQKSYLSLITTGDRYCIGTKGPFCLEAAWLWRVKDYIDRKWMRSYTSELPEMKEAEAAPSPVAVAAGPEALAAMAAAKMRCGGCGAKVGASILSRVLARLPQPAANDSIVLGLDAPDDAAVVRPPPPGHLMVQTVDFFRSFVDDPFVFGAIAANHALGDCHAMGAQASTALAIAVVPFGLDAQVEEQLYQMLAGAVGVLTAAGSTLVGGHSCEGAELALGFCIHGTVKEGELLRKGGMQPGQKLVLTKPIGTGTVMAAAMRRKAAGAWVSAALASMQQSGQAAAACLRDEGATACTDVTGFGLLGHLVEMARPSQVTVRLDMDAVPLLPGAQKCVDSGVLSSLHVANAKAAASLQNADAAVQLSQWPLLVDPQTGGGLLASVPAAHAEACVQSLHSLGYPHACVIGEVMCESVPAHDKLVEIFSRQQR
ncbi:hypothetical protein WJX72_011939 [[Myrmecia] bisecta]|uniref:Selenide, water dikinase n=1 Tax=[Myrmecia] bisecta TaxID=41462 RepID=A0AAW1P2Z9_9CHLO